MGVGGRLGHGDEEQQHAPKLIEGLAEQYIVAVSAGTRGHVPSSSVIVVSQVFNSLRLQVQIIVLY